MTIDLHIVVSVVQLIVIAVGGLGFIWTLKSKLDLLIQETGLKHESNVARFNKIEGKLEELVATALAIAKQEMRMNTIDERILELSSRIHSYATGGARRNKATK